MSRAVATSTLHSLPYCAAVVGAGPAGVAALGQLLDSDLAKTIAWIDPCFNGGRLELYREVPSNTKTGLFVAYGEACQAFGGQSNPAVAPLLQLPQDRGCDLAYAHDLVCGLARRLRGLPEVTDVLGRISRIDKVDRWWQLSLTEPSSAPSSSQPGSKTRPPILAKNVFLATGSHPRTSADVAAPHLSSAARTGLPAAVELPLDTALSPAALQGAVTAADGVAVVGSSHSAVLALKNLAELPPSCRPHRIVNFHKSPLLYAEYRNDEHGQWILRDNTGLKGVAAEWAKQHLEPTTAAAAGAPGLERVCISSQEDVAFDRGLPGCTKIVYAIGYKRNPLPEVVVDGQALPADTLQHDAATGQLLDSARGVPLTGLFGYGIAFPELWTDPLGNMEQAVGMFKFMRYTKRVVPAAMAAAA